MCIHGISWCFICFSPSRSFIPQEPFSVPDLICITIFMESTIKALILIPQLSGISMHITAQSALNPTPYFCWCRSHSDGSGQNEASSPVTRQSRNPPRDRAERAKHGALWRLTSLSCLLGCTSLWRLGQAPPNFCPSLSISIPSLGFVFTACFPNQQVSAPCKHRIGLIHLLLFSQCLKQYLPHLWAHKNIY